MGAPRGRRWRDRLPTPEQLRGSRWLGWLGPALFDPRLWHVSRRGLALGVALGVFFGLLIPIAQIPVSAAAAVALRANVPAAVASTLVTNPLTFGPVYYTAWRIGSRVLGDSAAAVPTEMVDPQEAADEPAWRRALQRLLGVGKPLLIGLALMATAFGLLTYFAISWLWILKVWWTRRRRRGERRATASPD